MKRGFLHPRDSNVHQEGWLHHLSLLLPIMSVTRFAVFPLTLSVPSLFVFHSVHLSATIHLHSLGPPLDPTRPTRVVCPVRPFAPAFLYAWRAARRQLAKGI